MLSELFVSEIEAGNGETLTVAARRFPRTRQGRPVSLSCLLRWVMDGVTTPSGERVKLEAARHAGRWITTPQAIGRFISAQNPSPNSATSSLRTAAQRSRAAARAAQELDKMGF